MCRNRSRNGRCVDDIGRDVRAVDIRGRDGRGVDN